MKIIIWLWNPWLEYKETRHNVWFLFLDFLKDCWNFEDFKDSKFKWVISEWNLSWEKIILLKPLTFMNLSWESISSIVNFYKLDFRIDIIVIFDDMSMGFGKLRYRPEWSAWWHNWIKSLISNLWSEAFQRIKIWVWQDKKYNVSDWVLSKFSKEEMDSLKTEIFPQALLMLEDKFIS
ncbi:MAG: Peptidyl-tRNA hydrolase [uncultured bacterium (gcode 4)]|uniref:Peptidyl-tRNA hydrolase n=1 Tax=uncultured bacterium (gcode 4) TaxID=1234023 RepID=K2G2G0_9BACT|nr:MAG: Peptidyl-tRNA hydrolase [uncultured bacterium (gcode 4)]